VEISLTQSHIDARAPRATAPRATAEVPVAPARWRRRVALVARVALLAAAGVALSRELAGLSLAHVVTALRAVSASHLALAVAATVGSFALLGLVELIALEHAHAHEHAHATTAKAGSVVPRRTAIFTSFVANAFSQSIGFALFTGGAVRLRGYARHGLGPGAVARVTGVATLVTTLGLIGCGAIALLAGSAPLSMLGVAIAARPLGIALAFVPLAYLAWSVGGRDATLGRWRLARPRSRLAIAQLGLSALDWLLTGTVLYALMPAALGIGYWRLIRAYVLAQAVGMSSHVPAGAGVLEAMLLLLLAIPAAHAAHIGLVAGVVLFRMTYYLAPLLAALATAIVAELRRSRDALVPLPLMGRAG
jgi:uncharacterized membrane protein YbhN (UPF0104 family)